ncbi:MAG: folate-binding protein YgfZ [Proteobacteria bacterium]|nr:folate-binding protein YgfZ [Pseudomonadota bacterium]
MSAAQYAILDARGLLRAAGPDVRSFLQGMVSNDVTKIGPERAVWSAFLTPQGKFLHEFFMTEEAGPGAVSLLLDCEAARLDDLRGRLARYKLRAKIELTDVSADHVVAAIFGDGALEALDLPAGLGAAQPFGGGIAYVDPRLAGLGARAVLPRAGARAALEGAGIAAATLADYDALRIGLGVPDGSRDLEIERSPLLENGFDELHGIDWDKGCFMGQELTARTKYRALIKKRLLPVAIEGPAPEPGTQVTAAGKDAGVLRSSVDGVGLALLRLEHLDAPLRAGEARLTAKKPDWVDI